MATDDDLLPFLTRLRLAWLCLFRILFDPRFAKRIWRVQSATELPPSPPSPALAVSDAIPVASTTPALQLLSLLQREGRLIDFLQQDVAGFSDGDVGVAARVVHEGCRRALRGHVQIEAVRSEAEGSRIRLEAGFDGDEVKLVGDVRGGAPYAGVLRHRGWRATKLELPHTVGTHDARVLAPAEIELG